MPVTMSDVAKHAGVSKATVSRVINARDGHASQETIARVQQAIEELGYVPNRVAANLKKKNSMNIGLVLADMVNPFFAQIAQGVEDVLHPAGYSLILANTDNDPQRELKQIRILTEQQVDAVIIASSIHDGADHFNEALARDIDVVLINNLVSDLSLDAVIVDNHKGTYDAIWLLLNQGHTRIGIITGPEGVYSSDQRLAAYKQALTEAGLPLEPGLILEGNFRKESGYQLTKSCLRQAEPPTALFVSNNLMSMGALLAFKEENIRLPEQMSFISFDDLEWYSLTEPAITAVHQPSYEIGATAAEQVLRRLKKEEDSFAPQTIVLDTSLIVRDSTRSLQR